jgi:hypothetical protein
MAALHEVSVRIAPCLISLLFTSLSACPSVGSELPVVPLLTLNTLIRTIHAPLLTLNTLIRTLHVPLLTLSTLIRTLQRLGTAVPCNKPPLKSAYCRECTARLSSRRHAYMGSVLFVDFRLVAMR